MRLPRRPALRVPTDSTEGLIEWSDRFRALYFRLGSARPVVTAGNDSNNRASSRFGLIRTRPARARHAPHKKRGPLAVASERHIVNCC
jgi:hypothetical protein